VRFQLRAPQHLHIDSNFSDVDGPSNLTPDEWHYVTHTYDKNDGRLYLDGKLDGKASPMLNIKSPARLWIGGWYDVYSYEGAMDEVRVSSVARSPEWIKLEYANQAPNQCLVGHVVMQGGEVTLTADRLVLNQGETVTYKANVPGALSVSWTGAQGQLIAGRTGFSETLDLLPPGKAEFRGICRLWAVLPQGVIEKSVEVTWKRVFPEPVLKLNAPQAWDGRTELRLKLDVVNGEQLKVLKDGQRTYRWQISGAPIARLRINVSPSTSEMTGAPLICQR
jgi:hypothetical protein